MFWSSVTERHPSIRGLHLCAMMPLLWLTVTSAASCSSPSVTFHPITGADCVSSDFILVESGACDREVCGYTCARTPKCRAFTLPDGTCQCKMFLFDECSHRVQSVANCTHQVTVYVRSVPGVQPGRLCPPGFAFTRFGTSYKVVTSPAVNWAAAKQSCSQEAGLSKFADALDADELGHLVNLKDNSGGASVGIVVGGYQIASFYPGKAGWLWAACNFSIGQDMWQLGRPNDAAPGCTHLYTSNTGLDDTGCGNNKGFICECQSVF